MASAVVYAMMYYLQSVLIPFLIAIALKYLLTPLIDVLSCKGNPGCFSCIKLPRALAVLLSFALAVALLAVLALVLVRSISSFTEHSELYQSRLLEVLDAIFVWGSRLQGGTELPQQLDLDAVKEGAMEFLKGVSLGDLILTALGTAATVAENLMYIVLFLVFMLLHAPDEDAPVDSFARTVDKQVFVYIRGKSSISAFVAITHAGILAAVGLDLWLAFGVLSFFLNFIPNIGMFTAILLPMPLVALDPAFAPYQVVGAFLGPLVVGSFAKDVLEPIILGNSTSLHPVAVLLSIMLFGSVWHLTGMVMAVPLTAVLRIYLSAVDHPLPRAVAQALAGSHRQRGVAPQSHTPRRVHML